ncbi:hypothetical protein [Actinomadura monticuli]|uniref:Uncharacterized protein n=1 Tax=Actinomadura monticuli TaxID=3097367 RepID=A0ABV4QLC2_9ACTN
MGELSAPGDAVDRSEGFGERLLGQLLDRAHEMPPQLIAPWWSRELRAIGGRDVSILLQDYAQLSGRVDRAPSTMWFLALGRVRRGRRPPR